MAKDERREPGEKARKRKDTEGTTALDTALDPRTQRDYKPGVPGTDEEAPADDYRSRKQRYQESLGVQGRRDFRRGLNEHWDDIARQYLSGVPLEQLIERYGEGGGPREGRNSVAWDQWTQGLNPGLQRAIRTRDMFQGAIRRGRVQEWPPGSGRYYGQWFSNKPQYYDALGNPLGNIAPPPPAATGIPTAAGPEPAPITPGTITSGGVEYNPPPTPAPVQDQRPLPTGPVGPPIQAPRPTGPSIRMGAPVMQPTAPVPPQHPGFGSAWGGAQAQPHPGFGSYYPQQRRQYAQGVSSQNVGPQSYRSSY